MDIGSVIKFILTNLPLINISLACVLGLLFFKHSKGLSFWLLRFLLLFPVGITGLWAFFFHVFYPEIASTEIGWEYSPFEAEVGMTNLGIGVLGIVSFFYVQKGFWLATVIMTFCFLFGDGLVHFVEITQNNNLAYNNAGPILYIDLILPVVLVILIFNCFKKIK